MQVRMTTVSVVGMEHVFKWLLERFCLSHVSSCEAPASPYTPPVFSLLPTPMCTTYSRLTSEPEARQACDTDHILRRRSPVLLPSTQASRDHGHLHHSGCGRSRENGNHAPIQPNMSSQSHRLPRIFDGDCFWLPVRSKFERGALGFRWVLRLATALDGWDSNIAPNRTSGL